MCCWTKTRRYRRVHVLCFAKRTLEVFDRLAPAHALLDHAVATAPSWCPSSMRIELPRMWFNKATTAEGLEALRQYRTAYDERLKTCADTPHRDWTTDIADAARVAPQSASRATDGTNPPPPHVLSNALDPRPLYAPSARRLVLPPRSRRPEARPTLKRGLRPHDHRSRRTPA